MCLKKWEKLNPSEDMGIHMSLQLAALGSDWLALLSTSDQSQGTCIVGVSVCAQDLFFVEAPVVDPFKLMAAAWQPP